MPVMSQEHVKVLPMSADTAMSLAEIKSEMCKLRPDFESLTGGWAGCSNSGASIGVLGAQPPVSDPVIVPANDALGFPEMLRARFYFWAAPLSGMSKLPNYDPHVNRPLAAVDVILTKPSKKRLGILFSTRTRQILHRRDGVVAGIESILKINDKNTKIDRYKSHLELQDTDIFLWLTVQVRDKPQLSSDLRLDSVSGICGQDASLRTADLRAGIDFNRPNFLTAVAEADTLGPIDLCFVQHVGSDSRSYQVKVHIDGGFEVRKNELHFPTVLPEDEMMDEVAQLLAYFIIPKINRLYIADGLDWSDRRMEVIEAAMDELRRRYETAAEALRERLAGSPGAD